MNIRKGFERFKGRLEEKAHDDSMIGSKFLQLTNSKLYATSSENSAAGLSGSPTASTTFASHPAFPQPSTKVVTADVTWPCFKALLKVLDKSAGVFGPLKVVMDEFLGCIEIYEAQQFTRKYPPRIY